MKTEICQSTIHSRECKFQVILKFQFTLKLVKLKASSGPKDNPQAFMQVKINQSTTSFRGSKLVFKPPWKLIFFNL